MPQRSAGTPVPPVLFLILFLPMGITNGYVVVTLGYLLAHTGLAVTTVAGLVAVFMLPQIWKFLWAPLVDTTFTNKFWYIVSALVIGVAMTMTAVIPSPQDHLNILRGMILAISLASTFNMMAADSLMAHTTTEAEKGRAGGWSQAGNLGGVGLGGGAGLWLAQHVSTMSWVSGAALGAVCVLSALVLTLLHEAKRETKRVRYADTLVQVGRDVWDIARSRIGFLALILMTLPIGGGVAQNLWSAVADSWQASADTVALVNGALAGVVSMVGCIAGGYICDRMNRKAAYLIFGGLLAAEAIGMALAPRTPDMFILFTGLYAFIVGMCYAAFGAVVLEAIGKGAAATKYNLLAGIANIPITYQTWIDGWADGKWGAGGMLLTEAAAGGIGILVFLGIILLTRRIKAFRA